MKPFISIFFGFCWNCQTSSYFVTISRVITTWRGSCFTKVVFYKKLFFNIVVLYFYSNSLKNTYEGIPFSEVVGLQPVNLLCKSYSVNLRIQSESGKIRTLKNSVFWTLFTQWQISWRTVHCDRFSIKTRIRGGNDKDIFLIISILCFFVFTGDIWLALNLNLCFSR